MPPSTRRSRLLLLIAALPLLAMLGLAVAVLAIPAERIAEAAAARAESALDREVTIERISVRWLPRPAVTLRGVVIGGARLDTDTMTDPVPALATAQRVHLRPRLLPLLRGRVVVDAIELDRPRVLLERDADGNLNLPLGGESDEGAGGDVDVLLRSIVVRDGRAGYRDAGSGTVIRLDGIRQRLRVAGSVREGRLTRVELNGLVDVDGFSAVSPEHLAVPISDLRVRVAHRAALDAEGDRLRVDGLTVRIQEIALDGRGEVRGLGDPATRVVDLSLEAGPLDVGRLFESLPEGLRQSLAERLGGGSAPSLDGRARIEARVAGRLGEGDLPAVAGRLEFDGVGLGRRGSRERLLSDVTGSMTFSLDSVVGDDLTGRLLGEPLRLAFAVSNPAAPAARFAVRTAVDLARARSAGLLEDGMDARGRVTVDLAGRGPLLEPARLALDGTVGLDGVVVRTPSLRSPLEVANGRLVFRGEEVRGAGVELRIGESDVTIEASATGWLPLALGDTSAAAPVVRVDATSRRIVSDDMFDSESAGYGEMLFARLMDRPVAGRTAGNAAGRGLAAIPPADLRARFRAAEVVQRGIELRDVDLSVAGRDGQIELRGADFQLLGGAVRLAGRIGAGVDGAHPLSLHFEVRDVGAAPFFQTLTPFRENLTGAITLAGSVSMRLDEHLLPVRETLAGEGTVAILQGQLANWPMFRLLGRELAIARFDTLAFRDWYGQFRFAGTRVSLAETILDAGEVGIRASGWFDYSGALDLGATVRLPREWVAGAGGTIAPRLAAAAAGEDGRLPLGVKVAGTFRSPALRLDVSEAAGAVADRVREEAEREARALADRAADAAAERIRQEAAARVGADTAAFRIVPAGVDSLAVAADSARARLEAELRRRLRPRPPDPR